MVQYRISLYAGPSGGAGVGAGVGAGDRRATLVEIVKTNKGCGHAFQNERRAIVNAAKGLGSVTTDYSHTNSNFNSNSNNNNMNMGANIFILTVTPEDLLDDQLDLYTPPTENEIEETLARITDQLHSKRDGNIIFALENLYSMTTTTSSTSSLNTSTSTEQYNSETAGQVSKYVIQNYNCVRDIIAAIFTHRASIMADTDGDYYFHYYEGNETICNLSLNILNNCMEAASLQKDTNHNSIDNYECKNFIDLLVPSLISTVANYNKNTHTACLAMKCLSYMAISSPAARSAIEVEKANIRKAVVGAKVYGSMEHLRLEEEADHTMRALQLQGQQLIAVAWS